MTPPFPSSTPAVIWMMANPYTGADSVIDALRKDTRFKHLAVAVIDLTLRTRRPDGLGWTTVDGWNMNEERFAASLAKIGVMFSAFRLRERVRLAAADSGAASAKDLFAAITQEWKPGVESAVPSGPKEFPHFDRIFAVTGGAGGLAIDFNANFRKHMRAMIEHSNNRSAGFCIDAVSFQYLNGALAAEGLYNESGGLWLGGNYTGRVWKREPKIHTTQGATATAVARLLTLVEQGRLVDSDASKEMRALMRLAGSWFGDGLREAKPARPVSDIYAKVGLYGTYHDCAVITRSVAGKLIRYAAVVLTARNETVLKQLIVRLDDYVQMNN
jgi:hypothetical protein